MKIYTSYFAKMRYLPKNVVPISICAKKPNWYNGLEYKILAPKYTFLMKYKEDHDEDYYTKCFNEQILDRLSVKNIIQDLQTLSNGKDICLLCYEKSTDFCHRHLVANWLRKNGFDCEEWK